eukprot:GHRR01010663.1.p1 GENE.GHRR01010663.1~~GHRR01010663.1.p1  ORF type:complete len:255 (+),score=74.88 GHRR01010663.1:481-1245(+)
MWSVRKLNMLDGQAAVLNLKDPDGSDGFPGNVDVWVIYKLLSDMNRLEITMLATTDKATPISLTTHAYFNLNGHNSNTLITDHTVQLNASYYTPTYNNTIVPIGEVVPVAGTAFDLRQSTVIGSVIDQVPGPDVPHGYDINYATGYGYPNAPNITEPVPKPTLIATLTGPKTGIIMDVYSNAPGFQWYSGNHLPDLSQPIKGKGGATYVIRGGFAVEPQEWPMSVKYKQFPSPIVRPGQIYSQQLVWDFRTTSA